MQSKRRGDSNPDPELITNFLLDKIRKKAKLSRPPAATSDAQRPRKGKPPAGGFARLGLLAIVAALAACVTVEERAVMPLADRLEATYGERCRLSGYSRGAPEYGRCLVAADDAERARKTAIGAAILGAQRRPSNCTVTPDGFGGYRTACQ